MELHKVNIRLEDEDRLVAVPQSTKAAIGDLIQWSSDHGEVTLQFTPADGPFASAIVHSGSQYTVSRAGRFSYRCTLKKKDTGQVISWPDDGGEVVTTSRGSAS